MVTPRVASDRRPPSPEALVRHSGSTRAAAARVGPTAPRPRLPPGPAPAAPREPRTSARVPVRRQGKRGRMSWAGQLWKQYDPINKIIFPGVGARPTYNERGVTGPARDAQPPIAPRLPSPLPVRDDRFNKHARSLQKTEKVEQTSERNDTEQNVFGARATQFFRVFTSRSMFTSSASLDSQTKPNKTSVFSFL